MKKLILAIAASACAMSAYAANPDPIDLKVQLAGKVPPQDVFKVTPVGWASGDEAKFDIPEGWNGEARLKEFPFQVKSSYGAIHMKLSLNSGGESTTTGHWSLLSDDGTSKISVKRQIAIPGTTGWLWVNEEKMEVASKEFAAKGAEIKLILSVYSNDAGLVKSGIAHTGDASVVFETDLDG
ncbi:hypothetical protein [Burkholderia sola]|uniref:hypothetical protein n=1 Tax=Burkholderia sola TaxID=2843302 RepID=UPI0023DDB22A|nr:hypothetical protein [Burkholderia sola]MDF3079898.1 hypothetical protein [Burkholderia sola]